MSNTFLCKYMWLALIAWNKYPPESSENLFFYTSVAKSTETLQKSGYLSKFSSCRDSILSPGGWELGDSCSSLMKMPRSRL
jgi:hypothetical protein